MDIIIYERPDGGLDITPISPELGETDADAIVRVVARNKEVGMIPSDEVGVSVVSETVLMGGGIDASLALREFRGSWMMMGGAVKEDLALARIIQKKRIDRAKTHQARELLEREMLGEDITADKAQLRAVNPQAIVDGAANIAALKAAWPASLLRR